MSTTEAPDRKLIVAIDTWLSETGSIDRSGYSLFCTLRAAAPSPAVEPVAFVDPLELAKLPDLPSIQVCATLHPIGRCTQPIYAAPGAHPAPTAQPERTTFSGWAVTIDEAPPTTLQWDDGDAPMRPDQGGKTGWPSGMLQDDSRELSRALSNTPEARLHVREAAAALTRNDVLPNEWRLPGDFVCCGATFRAGVHVRAVVGRMQRLYDKAFPGARNLTQAQMDANLATLQGEVPAEPSMWDVGFFDEGPLNAQRLHELWREFNHALDGKHDWMSQLAWQIASFTSRVMKEVAPPARDAGLSDDRIDEVWDRVMIRAGQDGSIRKFARAILAAAQERTNGG